jgi:hypothetical protein
MEGYMMEEGKNERGFPEWIAPELHLRITK